MKLNLSRTTLIQQVILQIITGLIVAANTNIVKAQLTPDNTVGSTTRSDTVKGLTSDIIEGGATRGTNLFHSFTNFNVDAGKGVYFSNPTDINNILTRVTGSSQSNIFGTLGVLGNANLFLINPNGISFGPNAQLDLKGSFVASTADKIVFDNYQFTTTNPTAPPLLTVNIPLGLGFRNNPGDINIDLKGSTLEFNNGQGLKVPQDKTLALIGGNVNINGNGVDAEGLRAGILSPGSRVQLGGLTQTGTVNFNENFYSTFPQGVTRGNVSLSNGAEINVRAAGGGSITINSRNLNVNENSRVRGGIQKNLGSVNAQAGDIDINNIEQVTIDNAVISNIVDEFGKGNAGDINIHTSSLILKNGSTINTSVFAASSEGNGGNITIDTANLTLENDGIISASTSGKGNAGNVAIKASQGVNVRGWLSSDVNDTAQGNSGGITIDTANLTLENGGFISADIYGKGNAGNIAIKASQGVNVRGWLSSDVNDTAVGNSGGITIDTANLTLENGGYISADTYGKGNAGKIEIQATEGVNVGGELTSRVNDKAVGDSGGITIDTSTLTLENDGIISASTFGKGNAGNIEIQATEGVKVRGRLTSRVRATAVGNGGSITIDTSTLTLEKGGFISASTFGKGDAGKIEIQATQGVTIGGFLSSAVTDTGVGDSGSITIDTSTLTLENGGIISASKSGKGNAGDIAIKATQGVTVGGFLTSGVFDTGEGNGGSITIDTSTLTLENDGIINASTTGKGNAGDINIKARNITIDQSGVYSFALGDGAGKGGNININTSNLTLKNGYISTETGGKGDAGNIKLGITDNLKLTNSSTISSGASSDSTGKAGSINIDPEFYYNSCIVGGCVAGFISEYNVSTLIELDDSEITVNSQGSGDGGDITLRGNSLNLNNSTINASTKSGQGGNINLNIPDTIRQNNSKIEASAGENGNGGNVTIDTKFIIGNGSNISANAKQGNGGNIKITTQGIFGYKDNQIDASSETGVNGVVDTKTPEVDPSQGLIDLPENLLTATIVTNSCRQGQNSQNPLIVKGRGGLALTSDQLFSSNEIEVDLIAPTSVKSSSAINPTSTNMEKTAFKTIIPAQGWEINSQGDVVLVAHSTGNPAERVNTAITCASN
ncbi:MAG: filamentous hemagglutinin N-terminal domain-containing protein [Dolichospermum sp.]